MENTKDFVLVDSGEVVSATSLAEAREKLARFNYTQEELDSIITWDEYRTHAGL